MARKLRLKRGDTAKNANYLGAEGEVTYDTQAKALRVHDGATIGGLPLVKSVNGQTGAVTISVPAATTIDGASGAIVTKKRPAAFGIVLDTHYTLNGFSERHVVCNPAYSFSPGSNQGGGIAVPKISADASWGLFQASRYTSNSSSVSELFAVDLFT